MFYSDNDFKILKKEKAFLFIYYFSILLLIGIFKILIWYISIYI